MNTLFSFNQKSNNDNKQLELCKYCMKNTKEINIGYITNVMIGSMKDIGTYIIMIETKSVRNGPCGIYAISKSDKTNKGDINILSYSKGQDCDVIIKWDECEYPKIIYYINQTFYINNKEFVDGYKIKCQVKII
jgi:hypothetical protein